MNARRAARELAMLALYQMDRQDSLSDPAVLGKKNLQDLVLDATRALSAEAEEKIRASANDLRAVSRAILDAEMEHPDNLNSPLEAEIKPVPLPNTRETADKIERCLLAAELLFEALRIPELIVLLKQEEVQDYALELLRIVAARRDELDEALNRHMAEWRMDRLMRLDACILRVAAAEMLAVPKVDLSVSINEAVDLAKQFSGEESYRLVNGVLGGLAPDMAALTGKTLTGVQTTGQPVG